jgi:uncharacterized integral membrane protein
MTQGRFIVVGGLILLAAIVLFQNVRAISVRILFWRVSVPLVLWTAAVLFFGLVLGHLVSRGKRR